MSCECITSLWPRSQINETLDEIGEDEASADCKRVGSIRGRRVIGMRPGRALSSVLKFPFDLWKRQLES